MGLQIAITVLEEAAKTLRLQPAWASPTLGFRLRTTLGGPHGAPAALPCGAASLQVPWKRTQKVPTPWNPSIAR